MEWPEILVNIEERLFPHFGCDVWERAHFYYILSQTRIKGVESATIPLSQIASALGCSDYSSRRVLRRMAEKGFIELDQTRRGHSVKAFLPSELPIPDNDPFPKEEIDIESVDFFNGRKYLFELLAREKHQCFYCLKKIDEGSCELDHVISQVSGGTNSYRNIVAACHRCNTKKQGGTAEDYLRSLLRSSMISESEFESRLVALEALQDGKLLPGIDAQAR